MNPEDRRVAYQQEWENVRHQDTLKWSRLQTLSVIEGGYLAALYASQLDSGRGLVLAIVASGWVALVSLMGAKDRRDATAHVKRAEKLSSGEGGMEIPSFKPRRILGMRGQTMLHVALWLLNLFNLAVIADQFLKLCTSPCS